ncbi:hypothetical protein [Undibacterium sp. TJN19]|uniref:hypothetical protein n=1 Tax=Undibacterium sp. TJN19 TaxID=3413055 RepID=UPI003BF2EA71
MQQASFSVNNAFLWNDRKYEICMMNDDGDVVLQSTPNNFTTAKIDSLLAAYCNGNLTFNLNPDPIVLEKNKKGKFAARRTLSNFSTATKKHSVRASQYLKMLLDEAPIYIDRAGIIDERILAVAVEIGDKNPPHKTTVFRWHKKFLASGGDKNSLIYQFENRGGKGQRRCSKEEAIIEDQLIEEMYLKERGASLRELNMQMDLICKRENEWLVPKNHLRTRSESSFRRRIHHSDPFEVVAAREGIEVAIRRFRSNGIVPLPKSRLEIVEIDHTPFDLFVIDQDRGIALGRPTLTMAICRKTKMPWGFHIGFDDCSADAVLACIELGIKPKTHVKNDFPEIKGDWPVFGIPGELRCDNGLEFHSKDLEIVASEIEFELAFCPKKQSNWKGSIESFLKTFNYEFVHKLPGTTLAKFYKRKGYDPEKCAVIDLHVLNRLVHTWVIDVYMSELHRGLGCSPRQAWNKKWKLNDGYLPFTPDELEIICNKTVSRPIWEYGVELNGRQKYNSSDLADLRRRIGVHENGKSKSEIKIKTLKFDIGHIWVFDAFEKIWLKVPNTQPEYADGITLYQHEIIQKFAKQMYKESDDYQILIEAKERMRHEVAALSSSSNMADRSKAAKINGKTSRQAARKNSRQVKNLNQGESESEHIFNGIFRPANSAQSDNHSDSENDQETLHEDDDAYDSFPNPHYGGGTK